MNRATSTTLSLTLVTVFCCTGCVGLALGVAGAGAGIGTYAYIKGALEITYSSGYEETWAATLDTLRAFEIAVQSADKDAFGGQIAATRADATPVKIKITPVTSNSTTVKIRVGTFGDRSISEKIAARIKTNLED